MSRIPLNCLIVAGWLWLASFGGKGRRYIWKRRSYKFKGVVPHSGVAEAFGWKTLSIIEYIPNKHEFPSYRNFLILFYGRYRVWKMRAVEVRSFKTRSEALAYAKTKRRVKPSGRLGK